MKNFSEFHDPLNVRGFIIRYDNTEEGINIAKILDKYGYDVYDYYNIEKDVPSWDCFIPENDEDDDWDFCLAKFEHFKDSFPMMDYEEFSDKIGFKKMKKLEKPEIDPFGEENWGYVQENNSEDSLGILKHNISYNNIEEAVEIAKILDSYGYDVYDFNTVDKDAPKWTAFVPGTSDKCDFCLGKLSHFRRLYTTIDYDEFLSLTSSKRKTKIRKPEVDPFDEERWGFVQENVDFNSLKIGDRVVAGRELTKPFARNGDGKGKIIGFVEKYILILWDNGFDGYYTNNYISIDREKIKKPDIDPFDEERWGYIQESLTIDDFQVGDKVRINEKGVWDMHDNLGLSIEEYAMVRSNGVVIEVDSYQNRVEIEWENEDGSYYPIEYVEKIEDKSINKTKIRKPEVDPFDEEKWGFVQESLTIDDFQVGDRVKINELGIEYMHDNMHMTPVEYAKIRSDGEVVGKDRSDGRVSVKWKNGNRSGYLIKYVEKLKNQTKIKKPEVDPFDEENWGYVQESVSDVRILNSGDRILASEYLEKPFKNNGNGKGTVVTTTMSDHVEIRWH